jgi:hypothetical protein
MYFPIIKYFQSQEIYVSGDKAKEYNWKMMRISYGTLVETWWEYREKFIWWEYFMGKNKLWEFLHR